VKLLLILAFAFTLFNTGLIWTIQVVHYPGFLKVGKDMYEAYQQFHMRAITFVVGPSMLAELVFSGLLLFLLSQLGEYRIIYIISLALLALIWLHTALWAVPLHGKLVSGYDAQAIQSLVSANWWRTFAWTARALLLGLILYRIA
jgi:hypothetical protein